MIRILHFGFDTNLLMPEDPGNEGQFRQMQYCRHIGMQKISIILNQDCSLNGRIFMGGQLQTVSACAHGTRRQIIKAYKIAATLIRKFTPDLVEYQDPMMTGIPAFLIARRLGVPLIGGIFNDSLDNPYWIGKSVIRRIYNIIGRFIIRHSLKVRCDSRQIASQLNLKGYTRVRYIPFYIPWLERFSVTEETIRKRLATWKEKPIVLCVARLAEEKNLPLLLHAFARVREELGRGNLVIVGDGPLRDLLIAQSVELGIASCTTWVGSLPYLALPEYYQNAHIFALSSNLETSPRVLILAQAARLPAVSTATPGSGHIIKDGKTGILTPIGDKSAFSRALKILLTDDGLYQNMVLSGERYEWNQHGEAVLEQLREFYSVKRADISNQQDLR